MYLFAAKVKASVNSRRNFFPHALQISHDTAGNSVILANVFLFWVSVLLGLNFKSCCSPQVLHVRMRNFNSVSKHCY